MGSFQGLLSQQFVSQKVGRIAAEPVCAVRPEHPTLEVVELLAEESCGAVIVNSENDEIVGIITERDFLLRKIDWEQGTAEEIMTAAPSVIRKSGSIAKALHMMSVGGFRHLPVVHRKRYVEGVISVKNIVQAIYDILLKLHVGEQCELIGSHRSIQRYFCSTVEIFQPEVPIFVRPESSVHDALQKLKKSRSGAVTVVDEKEVLVGIFTDRDFIRDVAGRTGDRIRIPISDYMTSDPITANPDSTVLEVYQRISEGGFRHLPVVDKGKVVGMLSVKDFLDLLVEEIIEELRADLL